MQEQLRPYNVNKFLWSLRVYYEDTDAGGVVYYANYLKFMERARTEWLRSLGFGQERMLKELGMGFIVRKVDVDYHHPARLDDTLRVTARITRLGGASLTFYQEVAREHDDRLLCKGKIKIACVSLEQMQPMRIPEPLLRKIEDVE
jgi:acyl-CoA thioester hydrolase